ncbi:lipoprotein, partial [Robiginitalea sp.]|uniref:lipoprotein n=1 Tax=Robiginitalea sp. TaxID=1902411 RepID=UPI003C731CC8
MKRIAYYLLFAAILSGCSTFHRMKSNRILASADLNSSSFFAVIPFEYISSLPVFEVSIQGENYRFIFDTGGYTVFSDELTSKLSGVRKASYI